jgi:hypothetical protein
MRVVYYESRKRELKKRRKKDVMRVSAMRWEKVALQGSQMFFFYLKKVKSPKGQRQTSFSVCAQQKNL